MVDKKQATFQISKAEFDKVNEELIKYNIEAEEDDGAFIFTVQSNNVLYEITLLIIDTMTIEERLFSFNIYPVVHSFEEIQTRIYGRVIWNWK